MTSRGNNNTATQKKVERNVKGSERQEIADNELMEVMDADCHRGFNTEGCVFVGHTPRYE